MEKQLTAFHKQFLKQTQNTLQKNLMKAMVLTIILISQLQVIEAREIGEALSMVTNLTEIQDERVSTVNPKEKQVTIYSALMFHIGNP